MERRVPGNDAVDRRAIRRGGRRDGDRKQPWYLRRPLLLTTASLIFVGWKRLRATRKDSSLARADSQPPTRTH